MNENTKLYVLTGFLGEGRIILLLKILRELLKHRIGIIQNAIWWGATENLFSAPA